MSEFFLPFQGRRQYHTHLTATIYGQQISKLKEEKRQKATLPYAVKKKTQKTPFIEFHSPFLKTP